MKYPRKHKKAHELMNFANENGFAYGFVENNGNRINIGKLGATKGATELNDVTVIWCAVAPDSGRLKVVGWFDNAKVFESVQQLNESRRYQFVTGIRNARLIAASDRFLDVPTKGKITDRGYIGQSNWFFPDPVDNYARFLEAFELLRKFGNEKKTFSQRDREGYEEGQKLVAEITVTIRNPKLAKRARAHYGVNCQVCAFNFQERYGDIGSGFIEVHHLTQLALTAGPRIATLDDVCVVCANCHRMMHRRTPPFTVEEMKRRVTYHGRQMI
jgi:5-methylcytosine-specific restriction protein A